MLEQLQQPMPNTEHAVEQPHIQMDVEDGLELPELADPEPPVMGDALPGTPRRFPGTPVPLPAMASTDTPVQPLRQQEFPEPRTLVLADGHPAASSVASEPAESEQLSERPAKSHRVHQSVLELHNGSVGLRTAHGWDGSQTLSSQLTGWQSSHRLDSDSDSDSSQTHSSTLTANRLAADSAEDDKLSAKEKKAVQREIPSHRIMALGEDYILKFVAAAAKEEEAWRNWQSVRPIM
eukprot:5961244-Amphidinium_carterae.1